MAVEQALIVKALIVQISQFHTEKMGKKLSSFSKIVKKKGSFLIPAKPLSLPATAHFVL